MCGYMAPALVSSSADLIDYWVEGSDPVNPDAKKGYSERFIHGEMFRMYPDVNCVVHSHAEEVLPYVAGGVPLVPIFHMAGFLGKWESPCFCFTASFCFFTLWAYLFGLMVIALIANSKALMYPSSTSQPSINQQTSKM
jgi:Class II Aldolase and Adducin N-terminal domain